jgi:hypothetical protein
VTVGTPSRVSCSSVLMASCSPRARVTGGWDRASSCGISGARRRTRPDPWQPPSAVLLPQAGVHGWLGGGQQSGQARDAQVAAAASSREANQTGERCARARARSNSSSPQATLIPRPMTSRTGTSNPPPARARPATRPASVPGRRCGHRSPRCPRPRRPGTRTCSSIAAANRRDRAGPAPASALASAGPATAATPATRRRSRRDRATAGARAPRCRPG